MSLSNANKCFRPIARFNIGQLYWLPIHSRNHFKLAPITYKALYMIYLSSQSIIINRFVHFLPLACTFLSLLYPALTLALVLSVLPLLSFWIQYPMNSTISNLRGFDTFNRNLKAHYFCFPCLVFFYALINELKKFFRKIQNVRLESQTWSSSQSLKTAVQLESVFWWLWSRDLTLGSIVHGFESKRHIFSHHML